MALHGKDKWLLVSPFKSTGILLKIPPTRNAMEGPKIPIDVIIPEKKRGNFRFISFYTSLEIHGFNPVFKNICEIQSDTWFEKRIKRSDELLNNTSAEINPLYTAMWGLY